MEFVSRLLAHGGPLVRELLRTFLGVPAQSEPEDLVAALREVGAEAWTQTGRTPAKSADAISYTDCVTLAADHLGVDAGEPFYVREFRIPQRLMRELWDSLSPDMREELEVQLSQRLAHITGGRIGGPTATLAGTLRNGPSSRRLAALATAVLGVLIWKRRLRRPLGLYRNAAALGRLILRLPPAMLDALWAEHRLDQEPFAALVPCVILLAACQALEVIDAASVMDPGGVHVRTRDFAEPLQALAGSAPSGVDTGETIAPATHDWLENEEILLPEESVLFVHDAGGASVPPDKLAVLTEQRFLDVTRGRVVAVDLGDVGSVEPKGTELNVRTLSGDRATFRFVDEGAATFFRSCLEVVATAVSEFA